MDATSRRIILLGKTGAGKSSLANTIFGEELFITNDSPNSGTSDCQAQTKSVAGRRVTLIDTPGLFDTGRSEEEMKPELVRCITECAPGPHAFLLVLKVEKYTEQEQAVVTKIRQCFSEEALKYTVIVFTHGDQLPDGMKIDQFVTKNKKLNDLVKQCGGRCHVFDNKYWKNNEEDDYRCNQVQVKELFNTVDKMAEANRGSYTNEMLQAVKGEIQRTEEQIRQSSGNLSQEETRKQAQMSVYKQLLIRSAGLTTGALLGALLGVAEMVTSTVRNIQDLSDISGMLVFAQKAAQTGGFKGGSIGYNAAQGAASTMEAMNKAAKAVWNESGFAADRNNK